MWIVVFGRHYVYLKYHEMTFTSKYWVVAASVYLFWWVGYHWSMMPVRYLKMYRSESVIKLNTYSCSFTRSRGIRGKFGHRFKRIQSRPKPQGPGPRVS